MIITIDGTASSGKSTITKQLSKVLKMPMLTTGSIYRAITLKVLNNKIDYTDDNKLKEMLKNTKLRSQYSGDGTIIYLDDQICEKDQLGSPIVSNTTPLIACKPFVREFVRKIQRETAKNSKDIIVEGRDIGTVVFPNADFKFFIDASLEERAKRRMKEYQKNNPNITLKEVIKDLDKRDKEDEHRDISPLVKAVDAILIDTTAIAAEEAVEMMIKYIKK
ncbi:MAG: (d)CMP kinase [Clostridia bacterium]|nr:(d)CMP kinase [Clostridia bacterium]